VVRVSTIAEPSDVTVVKTALLVWCAPVPVAVGEPDKVISVVFVSTLPLDSVAVVVTVETWPAAPVPLPPLPPLPPLRLLRVVVAIPVVMVSPSDVTVLRIVETLPDACSPSVLPLVVF
jgi:hypothetical protein